METGRYFLGVDGGGTKTAFVLVDQAGEIAASHEESNAYHLQIGLDGLRDVLAAGVRALLAKVGIGAGAIRHAFFGLPAYGEDSRIQPLIDALPEQILGHRRYHCGNDMVCGWAGSLAGGDGINIVAGTGSIGYGEREGRAARAGGWGELFSDEGSAHWIAVQGLNLFSRMSDGRRPKGPLHAMMMDLFALSSELDLSGRIMAGDAASRDHVASLSRLVSRAAEQGDDQAAAILGAAAQELVAIVEAVRVSLGYPLGQPVPVSYSGGVFRAGDGILVPFRAALAQTRVDYILSAPRFSPMLGAAIQAARLVGYPLRPCAVP